MKRVKRIMLLLAVASAAISCSKTEENKKTSYDAGENKVTSINSDIIMDLLAEECSDGEELQRIMECYGITRQDIDDVVAGAARADTQGLSLSDIGIGSCVFKYPSTDCLGNKVELSGKLYYPCDYDAKPEMPDHVVLACHHTSTMNSQVPSSGLSLEILPVLYGALVVAPDYMGFGVSSDKIHPYCATEITAVNCTDMVLCALEYFSDCGLDCSNLPFYIEGYSQGGHAALASVKYIQENLSDELEIRNAYCGAGPYSQRAILDEYLETNYSNFAIAPAYVILGYKTAFPEIMTENIEAYFTDDFNKSGIIDVILAKKTSAGDINTMIHNAVDADSKEGGDEGVHIDKILSKGARTPGNALYEQLLQCAAKCEIAKGWKPGYPVHFMHNDKDDIVTFRNFTAAKAGLMNSNTFFEQVSFEGIDGHQINGALFYLSIVMGEHLEIHPGGESVVR